MAIRNVVQVGDEVLRTKCFPVETFDESLHNLLNDMKDTLEKEDGAGLAAMQARRSIAKFIMRAQYQSAQT